MKKAVCIGVSYPGTTHHLPKAHDDALKMHDLLKNNCGYKNIKLLLDSDRPEVDYRPTRKNIFRAIDDLVKGVSKGDRLVFHFSGHGSQQIERPKGDRPPEEDKQDELIWPEDVVIQPKKDADIKNAIIDNEIHDRLVEKIPAGAHLTLIFDCCHSGTAADLPDVLKLRSRGPYKPRPLQSAAEPTVVSISACSDAQETIEFDKVGGLLVHYLYRSLALDQFAGSYQELFETLDRLLNNAYKELNKKATGDKAVKIRKTLRKGSMHPIFSILGSHETTMEFSL